MRLSILLLGAFATIALGQNFTACLDTSTELQIRNKLSLYAFAVDLKNYDLLAEVFTVDAVSDYALPEPLKGLVALQDFLSCQLAGKVTQHAISSTVIERPPARQTLFSRAYFQATFLGQGSFTGQTLVIYGYYTDDWVLDCENWKISNRVLTIFVRWLLVQRNVFEANRSFPISPQGLLGPALSSEMAHAKFYFERIATYASDPKRPQFEKRSEQKFLIRFKYLPFMNKNIRGSIINRFPWILDQ